MISPRTQRKRLLALADQLEAGSDLTPEQRAYLVACFRAMGHGEDGNSAFGLSYTPAGVSLMRNGVKTCDLYLAGS